jgi:hypothetical protein
LAFNLLGSKQQIFISQCECLKKANHSKGWDAKPLA